MSSSRKSKSSSRKTIKIAHFFGDQYVGTTEGKLSDLIFLDHKGRPLKKRNGKAKGKVANGN